MEITSSRFGTLSVDEAEVVTLPDGVLGFPSEKNFVLVRTESNGDVTWMQSTKSAGFALPIVSVHSLPIAYPDVSVDDAIAASPVGTPNDGVAMMAIVSAGENVPATINLRAPIVIDPETRIGAQIVLEESKFAARELFVLAPRPANEATSLEGAAA